MTYYLIFRLEYHIITYPWLEDVGQPTNDEEGGLWCVLFLTTSRMSYCFWNSEIKKNIQQSI